MDFVYDGKMLLLLWSYVIYFCFKICFKTILDSDAQLLDTHPDSPGQGWHSYTAVRHRPFIFFLDSQISTFAYLYASKWTRKYLLTEWNIQWKVEVL